MRKKINNLSCRYNSISTTLCQVYNPAEIDEDLKKVIMAATDTSTEVTGGDTIKVRLFAKDFIQSVLADATAVSSIQDITSPSINELAKMAKKDEVKPKGMFAGGQIAGMIKEILTVEEVIQNIIQGAAAISTRLGKDISAIK